MLNDTLVHAESLSDFDLAYKDIKALMFQTGYFTITGAEMRRGQSRSFIGLGIRI